MIDSISQSLTNTRARQAAARQRLTADIESLAARRTAQGAAQLAAFIGASVGLFTAASTTLAAGAPSTGAAESQLIAAESVAEAGRNAFQVMAREATTQLTKADYARTASLYNDVLCTLRNAWSLRGQVRDFSSLLGASTCSSTAGGSPPSIHANVNVVDKIFSVDLTAAGVRLSTHALAGIAALRADVLSFVTGSAAALPRQLGDIAKGLVVDDVIQ